MSVETPSQAACIHCDDVSYAYGSQSVLDGITFSISCGEYVGIVGPNGGGKTTLLKLILGLIQPKTGSIRINGLSPAHARKGGQIGYVPQRLVQPDFLFPASVEEIVRSGQAARVLPGGNHVSDKKDIAHAMERTQVSHLKHRQIGMLSGGERQRVFIARALAANPHILVLDEPTTGVDPASREAFYTLLRDLNASLHLTILFVTHDIDVMMQEAKTILCVNQNLLCHVPAKSFQHDAALQELYGSHVAPIHHHHH